MAANRILYRSPALTGGQFRCPPENWRWRDVNVNGEAAEELLAQVGLQPHSGIPFGQGASDSEAYLRLRLAACALVRGDHQPLAIEEAVHHAFTRSLERGIAVHHTRRRSRRKGTARPPPARRGGKGPPDRARLLQRLPREPRARLHISAFHLARVFRERTGFSLHAYRTHLRLRLALERLSGAGTDLGWMARELGFSSLAHFTGVFNSVFGEPPSAVEPEGVTTSRLTTVT